MKPQKLVGRGQQQRLLGPSVLRTVLQSKAALVGVSGTAWKWQVQQQQQAVQLQQVRRKRNELEVVLVAQGAGDH